MIDGTISNQPNNIVIYVTSNRRHLMPEDMIDNEKSSAIHISCTYPRFFLIEL